MAIRKTRRQVTMNSGEIAATLLADYRRQVETLRAQGGQESTIAKVEALIARIAA